MTARVRREKSANLLAASLPAPIFESVSADSAESAQTFRDTSVTVRQEGRALDVPLWQRRSEEQGFVELQGGSAGSAVLAASPWNATVAL